MAFLAAPFSLTQKAHAFMHGICAQRPSHSLSMGSGLLPFDGRMTGIYLGFLVAFVLLLALGRHRHGGLLSRGALLVVLGFVGAMAVDGFNSLLADLRYPALYQPDNRLRLFTGMGAGVGLAIMLTMLLGMSLWRRPRVDARIAEHWWQPLGLYLAGIPVALLLLSGNALLLAPVTVLLVLSAVTAFAGLGLVSLVMVTGKDNSFDRASDMQPHIVAGAALGILAIALLACGRYALESFTKAPPLT